jgi:Holliday junction resolvase
MDFEEIKTVQDLQKVSRENVWQNFERLAAFIFEKNNFQVKINVVKTGNRKRRQYDVVAIKGRKTFLIECKKWAGSRYRLSALRAAIEKHKERADFYRDLTGEDVIPIVVTLIEEEIKFYEAIPVVPIFKLNSFIYEIERDADEPRWSEDAPL